jgi:hypothetical protein
LREALEGEEPLGSKNKGNRLDPIEAFQDMYDDLDNIFPKAKLNLARIYL